MKYLDLVGLQGVGRVITDAFTSLAIELVETKYSEFTVVASDPDADGVYRTVTWTRRNGRTYAKSTLSGDPFNRLEIVYYHDFGIDVVAETIAWNLITDENGIISKKELTA